MADLEVTWDYRCPFARNLTEHLLLGPAIRGSQRVTFLAFSLDQANVEEGQPDVWDDPAKAAALLAGQAGIAVRDGWPDDFQRLHLALFAARHDEGRDLRDEAVVREVLTEQGLDAGAVMDRVASGEPLRTFRAEHERAVSEHQVFGVPTIISAGHAAFIRVSHRPSQDPELARRTVDRLLSMVTGWPDLHEFKRTAAPPR